MSANAESIKKSFRVEVTDEGVVVVFTGDTTTRRFVSTEGSSDPRALAVSWWGNRAWADEKEAFEEVLGYDPESFEALAHWCHTDVAYLMKMERTLSALPIGTWDHAPCARFPRDKCALCRTREVIAKARGEK